MEKLISEITKHFKDEKQDDCRRTAVCKAKKKRRPLFRKHFRHKRLVHSSSLIPHLTKMSEAAFADEEPVNKNNMAKAVCEPSCVDVGLMRYW
jgi:hypothetical protein